MKNIILITLALILASCVNTRNPELVQMKQAGDTEMGCEKIATEYKANTESATAKTRNNRKGDRKELWYGILIWPGLMDFKNADGAEGNSLLDRNIRLLEIAKSKKCDVKSWPDQPKRYY